MPIARCLPLPMARDLVGRVPPACQFCHGDGFSVRAKRTIFHGQEQEARNWRAAGARAAPARRSPPPRWPGGRPSAAVSQKGSSSRVQTSSNTTRQRRARSRSAAEFRRSRATALKTRASQKGSSSRLERSGNAKRQRTHTHTHTAKAAEKAGSERRVASRRPWPSTVVRKR